MDADCIFCRVISGELPAKPVYRDQEIIAIEDVNPQAPAHVLVMPLRHYRDFAELLDSGNAALTSALLAAAVKLGRERGGDSGYRLVANTGPAGGQTVGHLHLHVLAGRPMRWPPG